MRAEQLHELTEEALSMVDSTPLQAREPAERARELAVELDDAHALARVRFVLGCSWLAEADYGRAESELRAALEAAQSVKDSVLMVRVLRALLKCGFLTRNTDAALLRGMQALQLAAGCGDPVLEALTHSDLGSVYGALGDFEGALEHLMAGLRIMRENDAPKVASLLNNIGNVYLELEDPTQAETFFRSAIEAARQEAESWMKLAAALGNVGRAHLGLKQAAEALDHFQESLAVYESNGAKAYVPPALARVGTGLAAAGRTEEAGAAFERAIALLRGSAHQEFADEVFYAAGRFELGVGRVDEAIRHFEHALSFLPADEATRRVYELNEALSEAHEKNGDLARALRYFREYHRIREAIANSAITVRIRGLMLQFDVERARQQEEIFRLRNVELAQANEELHALHERLEAKNRELHQISIKDSLTLLYNRRYLDLQLGVEISRARRHQRPLCAAMCDIDHFKEINDRHSHRLGDEVLRRMAALLRETARTTDIVSRYGGEEFLLILPDTDLVGAETLTERLRTIVAEHPWHQFAPGLRVTLSIGIAQLDEGMDGPDLLESADARLYDAKRAGRDRVVA